MIRAADDHFLAAGLERRQAIDQLPGGKEIEPAHARKVEDDVLLKVEDGDQVVEAAVPDLAAQVMRIVGVLDRLNRGEGRRRDGFPRRWRTFEGDSEVDRALLEVFLRPVALQQPSTSSQVRVFRASPGERRARRRGMMPSTWSRTITTPWRRALISRSARRPANSSSQPSSLLQSTLSGRLALSASARGSAR